VTATRDRRSDLDDDELDDGVRWNDRAMFGSFRGLPWWAAVLIAFALAIIGTYLGVDVDAPKPVGMIFFGMFFAGAVGAVVFVERRSMFGPIVQPPLILAITVPLTVLAIEGMPKTGGLGGMALTLGKPLIGGFPTMAITTAFTVGIGILRVMTQKDPNRPTKDEVREAKADAKAAKKSPVAAEDRPKRPRPPVDDPEAPPRRRPPPEGRRPAPASDEDRPKRPRPPQGERPSGERRRPAPQGDRPQQPRRPRQDPPAQGGRPAQPRRPRPRDDD